MCEKPIINACQLSVEKLSAPRIDSLAQSWKEKVGKFNPETSHQADWAKLSRLRITQTALSIYQLFPARVL